MSEPRTCYRRPAKVVDGELLLMCTKCGIWKEPDQFHLNSGNASGRMARCIECRAQPSKRKRRKWQRRPEAVNADGERTLLCTRCEEFKTIDHFYLDTRSPSGHTNYCYPCRAEVSKQYSLKRAEQHERNVSVERIKRRRRKGDAPPIPSLADLLGA